MSNIKSQNLANTVLYTSRVHHYYVLAYAASLIIFDSWNLIPNEGMQKRWTAAGLLLLVNTVIWYLARNKTSSAHYFRTLSLVLMIADIIFAAYIVYLERGMASRSVFLFAVPIVLSAATLSRRTIYGSAFVSSAAYVMAITRYFTEHYGEGYKVELYGFAALYTALFFVLAGLLWVIVPKKQ